MPHPNGGRGSYFSTKHTCDDTYNYVMRILMKNYTSSSSPEIIVQVERGDMTFASN